MNRSPSGIDFEVAYDEICIDVGSISVWLTEADLIAMLEELRSTNDRSS